MQLLTMVKHCSPEAAGMFERAKFYFDAAERAHNAGLFELVEMLADEGRNYFQLSRDIETRWNVQKSQPFWQVGWPGQRA